MNRTLLKGGPPAGAHASASPHPAARAHAFASPAVGVHDYSTPRQQAHGVAQSGIPESASGGDQGGGPGTPPAQSHSPAELNYLPSAWPSGLLQAVRQCAVLRSMAWAGEQQCNNNVICFGTTWGILVRNLNRAGLT
jgi:hypothetical protein